jgi:hypothetical protein
VTSSATLKRHDAFDNTLILFLSGTGRVVLELDDFETDPVETRNLASAQREVVKQLTAILAKHPQAVPPGRE